MDRNVEGGSVFAPARTAAAWADCRIPGRLNGNDGKSHDDYGVYVANGAWDGHRSGSRATGCGEHRGRGGVSCRSSVNRRSLAGRYWQ